MVDTDSSGSLSLDEVREALGMTSDGQRLLEKKLSLPEHTIEKMTNCFARVFDEMDVDNSGSISFIEFADYFQRRAVQLNAKGVINNDGKLKKGKRFRLARIFFDGEDIAEDKTLGKAVGDEGGNFEKKPPNPGFVIGKHDHEAEMEGDLEFKVGDRIEVIDTHSSGWWFGKNLRTMLKGDFPENFIDFDISGERNDSKSRMDNEESIEKNIALQQLDVGFASGDFEGTTTTGNILHGDKIKRSMREGENNGNFELQSNESTPSQTSTPANQEILPMEEVHFRESKAEKSSVPEARGDSETVLSDQPDQESIDNDSAIFSPLPKKSSVSSLPPMSDRAIDDAESQPSTSSGPQPLPEEEEPDLADPRAALTGSSTKKN